MAAKKKKAQAFYAQSGKLDWCTPLEVLRPVWRFADQFHGGIGLDPAGHPMSIVRARRQFTGPKWGGMDGLAQPWTGYGLVWINPEYGRALDTWAPKIRGEAVAGAPELVLVPASTETGWWTQLTEHTTALCLWGRRIPFYDRDYTRDSEGVESGSTFSAALLYTGIHVRGFRDMFGTPSDLNQGKPFGEVWIPGRRVSLE